MYLAHSKLSESEQKPKKAKPAKSDFAHQMAYKLYKKACKDNEERIKQIQVHFPGWMPKFNYPLK